MAFQPPMSAAQRPGTRLHVSYHRFERCQYARLRRHPVHPQLQVARQASPRRVSAAITYPAMTLVEVKSLFDDAALIEIEGIVVIGEMK